MATLEKHAPGSFCWMELATTNQTAAKNFYAALFGWESKDSPMGPDRFYTTFSLGGRKAAACHELQADELALQIPPHWKLYISVANAAASTELAREAGGKVFCGPLDVATHGLMSTIADPTGAVFNIWESKEHPGIGVQAENGSFCWADLSTSGAARAAAFYTKLFGWSIENGKDDYAHIVNNGDFIGGIPPASHRKPGMPAHWLLYFQTSDCDASTAKAKQLGATIHMGPMSMEKVGRMTVLADPQGAVFSLFQPFPHE
jgi:predicted enzyme related to lactoylglutathione lyase